MKPVITLALMDSTWIAIVYSIIAALPPTITSLAVLRQSKDNAEKNEVHSRKIENKLDENTAKTVTVDGKVDIIHDLSNSKLTAIKAELEESKERIKKLEELVVALTTTTTIGKVNI